MKGYSFRSLTDLVLKIFKTKVNAGTGLSGGGSLEADRTLTVKYGTAAGTAAQGDDSRLSNSREWIGDTINQAETEAGTATTRRAFTAQRVRQNIVAWWFSITGVFGRDLVTSASNSVARDKLGLFTSALRWPTWAEVTGKPATFDPSSHTHPWSQVTDQPVTATRWPSLAEVTGTPANYPTTWDSVAAKPAQATRWPAFAEVTDKPINYPTTWNSVAAKPAQATRWPTFAEVSSIPATATRWPTLAEVTDKPTNYPTNWATVSGKPVVQTVGTSTTNLMSQKAITDQLANKTDTSTQVIAGTGLSGGGTLAADRTLSVNYSTPQQARELKANDVAISPKGLGDALGAGLLSSNGYVSFPVMVAGVRREMFLQWMSLPLERALDGPTVATATLPIAFPNAILGSTVSLQGTTFLTGGTPFISCASISKNQVRVQSHYKHSGTGCKIWAWGW